MPRVPIKIPFELFAVAESSRFEGNADIGMIAVGADDVAFCAPVAWRVDVTNVDGSLLVLGTASAPAHVPCARCLEDVQLDLEGRIEGWFQISGDGKVPDEVGEDEVEALPADHIIDLEPLIIAALMMEVPGQPLCSPDCAGLCPYCGADLNEGPCGCEGAQAAEANAASSSPFAVLADLDLG